jgi:hypothetical protein
MTRRKHKGRGGARPGSGRPPKPAAEKQRNAVMIRLTDAEREALEGAAGGEPLGVFLRRLVNRYLARRR